MVERMIMGPGQTGPFVRDLQLALNARLMPSPNLMINGSFNAETQKAVIAFQETNWLCPSGHCDQATLDCLYGAEAHRPIQHNLRYQPRQNPQTGWAAMVAMLRRVSLATILAGTPAEFLSPNSGLASPDSADQRQTARRRLLAPHGLTLHPGLSLTVSRLVEALRQGPVGLERLYDPMGPRAGKAPAEFLVVAAARGSHGPSGTTTTLRIYDPDPGQQGGIYSQTYAGMLRAQPGTRFALITG